MPRNHGELLCKSTGQDVAAFMLQGWGVMYVIPCHSIGVLAKGYSLVVSSSSPAGHAASDL